jgi:hypothetical protein
VIAGILLGIVAGLLANELCEFSPWCARKLVRWSAFQRYTDPGRVEMRAEELTAVINDRPGNLFKLITAVSFAANAVIVSGRRAVARESDADLGSNPAMPASPHGPDGLSRTGAEAAWHAVTALIAGTPHVRISRDGGRTYPARYARPLPADPPGQPTTMPVYDPSTGTGRMLALDFDPARVDHDVDDAAVRYHRHGGYVVAEVGAQAEALAGHVTRCGGQVLADVSPGGGRHVYVLFVAPLCWRELRDLARAMAFRFPAIDPAPMSSLGGQISPPGSRHKSGGWRLLSTSLEDAGAVVEHPNGPEVWGALLAEFAAELQKG